MFKFIRNWYEKQWLKRKREGFDYAAGRLLDEGDKAVHELHLEAHSNDFDEFDRGILLAIYKWHKLQCKDSPSFETPDSSS